MSGVPRTVRIARAVHRWLSVLVPRAVRHTYREEMIATFETALAEASARGRTAVCVLLAREIKDLATARVANRPASVVMPGPASAGSSTRAPAHEWMDLSNWLQSWRSLRRRPAFLAAAVLTLGLGGGITIAVFALVNTVLVKPLPFPNGDDLVMADAVDRLAKTGGLQVREVQPSPALVQARDAVSKLVVKWDDGLAEKVAAGNLFLDRSKDRRRKQLDDLHATVGSCAAPDKFDVVENALRGQWTMSCERGKLQVSVTLAPTMPPSVQFMTVRAAPAVPAKVTTCVQ